MDTHVRVYSIYTFGQLIKLVLHSPTPICRVTIVKVFLTYNLYGVNRSYDVTNAAKHRNSCENKLTGIIYALKHIFGQLSQ